jgi:hypothetical protein
MKTLLRDLDLLENWPDRVKQMQTNWIGRSKGAEFEFTVVCVAITLEICYPFIPMCITNFLAFLIYRTLVRKNHSRLKYLPVDQTQYMAYIIWLYHQNIL